jgi:phage-related minor tail protein
MGDPKIKVEIEAKIDELKKGLKEVERELGKTGKSINKIDEFAKGALQGIAAAFTVGAVVNFGKAVLDTTAKFQKFEAVLTNTLGSSSEAQLALSQISQFASNTPFQVDELTSAFIKLANQGFRATTKELTSLGDLAASTGKSFDQLAEAIIDAQVGEFERLKEFGIRAKKEGDQVTFTFKGVETQVKATDEAIRGYILSLGDAEGVSGAMAAVSQTVGGKISNLEDNIESLRKAIGNRSSGVFATSLDWLNTFVKQAELALKGIKEITDEVNKVQFADNLSETRKEVDFLIQKFQEINPALTKQEAIQKAVDAVTKSYRELSKTQLQNGNITIGQLQKTIREIKEYGEQLGTQNKKVKEAKLSFEEFAKAQDEVNKKVLEGNPEFQTQNFLLERQKTLVKEVADIYDKYAKQIAAPIIIQQPSTDVDISGFQLTEETADNPFTDAETKALAAQSSIKRAMESLEKELNDRIPTIEERLTTFGSNVDDIIRNNVTSAFIDLGYTIGEALASGANVIQAIGESLLNSMGKFLGQLGEQLIAFGVAGLAFGKVSLGLTNPFTAIKSAPLAIAAGVALTAISGAIGSIGKRGLGGGGSFSTSGVSGGTTFSGQGATGLQFDRSLQLSGEFRVKGQDLVYVFNEASTKNQRG